LNSKNAPELRTTFGLVTIPIRVCAVTESKNVSFRQVHKPGQPRTRNERVCVAEGKPMPWQEITCDYELPGGQILEMGIHPRRGSSSNLVTEAIFKRGIRLGQPAPQVPGTIGADR
jgi:hypothetical protein